MHWKRSEFVCSSVVLSVSAIKSGSFNLIFEIELVVSSSCGHTRSFSILVQPFTLDQI